MWLGEKENGVFLWIGALPSLSYSYLSNCLEGRKSDIGYVSSRLRVVRLEQKRVRLRISAMKKSQATTPSTNQLRYDHITNLVDEHGLCAANVAACRAFDKLTPSISNGICPVDTRAIQPVGLPFPLPIRTSIGFPVIGRSARTLTHILAFLRNCPLIARWNCPIVARWGKCRGPLHHTKEQIRNWAFQFAGKKWSLESGLRSWAGISQGRQRCPTNRRFR